MGVECNQPAHLLDRYIKGGDINGGRLYFYDIIIILLIANSMLFICDLKFENVSGWGDLHGHLGTIYQV